MGLVGASILLFRHCLQNKLSPGDFRTAVTETGDVSNAVRSSGIIIPRFEHVVTSPIQTRVDSLFKHAGDQVRPGDRLIQLDLESLSIELDRNHEELALYQNRLEQLKLERNREQITLDTEIRKMELTIRSLDSALEQQRRLHEIGAVLKAGVEQAELNLEIAKLDLQQINFNRRNSEELHKTAITELNLQIQIQEKRIQELERQYSLAQITCEWDGILTWIMGDLGSMVSAGSVIARIADLNEYKIRGRIADVHGPSLAVGTPVRIRLSDETVTGKIESVDPTIQNGVITFYVELADTDHSRLRSNQRVDLDVITATQTNVIRVRYGPFAGGPGKQGVYVIHGDEAVLTPVVIGAVNLDWVEIKSGLEEGEIIIISEIPSKHQRSRILLKPE